MLKPWIGDGTPNIGVLLPLRNNGTLKLQAEQVLQVRWTNKAGASNDKVADLLIKWNRIHEDDATWGEYDQISASFPEFTVKLEDKVHLEEKGIDGIQDVDYGRKKCRQGRDDLIRTKD